MTPSKEKLPLPKSESAYLLSHGRSTIEFQRSLQTIKVLFLRRQFKECVSLCEQLLVLERTTLPMHAAQECYLHFYHASSKELLARLGHNLSVGKLSLLVAAKASYEAALTSIDEIERLPLPTASEQSFSPDSASDADDESDIMLCSPTPYPRKRRAYVSSSGSTTSLQSTDASPMILASPPRIIKTPVKAACRSDTPSTSSTPPQSSPSTPSVVTFHASTDTWLHSRAIHRYYGHATELATMIRAHINTTNALIQATEEAQKERYVSRQLPTHTSDEARITDKKLRIEKGRERKWARKRFCPRRTEEICHRALMDL